MINEKYRDHSPKFVTRLLEQTGTWALLLFLLGSKLPKPNKCPTKICRPDYHFYQANPIKIAWALTPKPMLKSRNLNQ